MAGQLTDHTVLAHLMRACGCWEHVQKAAAARVFKRSCATDRNKFVAAIADLSTVNLRCSKLLLSR